MNIVFGMCGEGKRFKEIGVDVPKYLVPIYGAPMIYHSVTTLNIPGKIHFIIKTSHLQKYKYLEKLLLSIGDNIITCDRDTEGAAETLLLAKNHINLEEPFISVNCDQYMSWDSNPFVDCLSNNTDVSWIPTFKSKDANYSYLKTDGNGWVTDIKEKHIISENATAGIYHWCKAKYFFRDAEEMINNKNKQNNEYYVAPVYKNSIANGLLVRNFDIKFPGEFWPVGNIHEIRYLHGTCRDFD